MLVKRGKEKLSENKSYETFDGKINMVGLRPYTFGIDYKLGDFVTVVDFDTMIKVDTQITSTEEFWEDEGYSLNLIFGDESPTI